MVGDIVKKYYNIGELRNFEEGSSIKLCRLSSGNHTWEIKIYGTNPKQTLASIKQIDADLELLYGVPSEEGKK